MRLVVAVETDLDRRVAQALAADPEVQGVVTSGGPIPGIEAWDGEAPIDAVVGRNNTAQRLADEAGVPAILSLLEDAVSARLAIWAASPLGLGVAMASRGDGTGKQLAFAAPGPPAGVTDPRIAFPRPVGARRARAFEGLPLPAFMAGGPGPWGAILVKGGDEERAVVDDDAFMQAVTLAAGIALLPVDGAEPVWSRPQAYLAKVEEMGLRASARKLK